MTARTALVTIRPPGYTGNVEGAMVPLPSADWIDGGTRQFATQQAANTVLPGMAVRFRTFGGNPDALAAKSDAISTSEVSGIAIAANDASFVYYKTNGDIAELTTAQWDVVTGGVGGLAIGSAYYLDDTTAGHLALRAALVTAGHFLTKCGVALSATQMLILLGQPQVI